MKELKFVNSVDKFIEVWKDIDDEVRFRLLKKYKIILNILNLILK